MRGVVVGYTRNMKIQVISIVSGVLLACMLPATIGAESVLDLQAKINDLLRQINALQTAPTAPALSASACPTIERTLRLGARGVDVSALQMYLKSRGYLTANATGYFGVQTEAGVKKFQAEQGVVASGTASSTGFGVFGAKTRAALAHVCALPSAPTPTPTPTPTPSPAQAAPTLTLTATPSTITSGQSMTLTWSTGYATSCSSTGSEIPGTVGANGSVVVSPINSAVYTLVCTGAGGSVSVSASVEVKAKVPVAIPPTVSYTSPSGGPTGIQLTVYGTHFGTTNTVIFSTAVTSIRMAATSTDEKTISFQVPFDTPVGTYGVSVVNDADALSRQSNSVNYMVTNPSISAVTPTLVTSSSQVLTLTGVGFNSSTKVYVGGISALKITPTSVSPDGTTLTFSIPSAISRGSKTLAVSNDGATLNNILYISISW